jgi:cysteine-rich repeat protein
VTATPRSECVAPAPFIACVPGGGCRRTDCLLAVQVRPVPALQRNDFPRPKLICYEGDARCDADTDLDNATCIVGLRLCINNSDARFPDCASPQIDSIEVRSPRASTTKPVEIANLTLLESQAADPSGGFGVGVKRGTTIVTPGSSNAVPNLCSEPLPVNVPLRRSASGKLYAARTSIKLRTYSASSADTDRITLLCRPSTCGNNHIEGDHEQCDDGNRNNGDGCNQACQIE